MILIATVGNLLDKPLVTVILPVYAKTFYGSPASLGLALGAFGAGALTGSLLYGAIGRGWPPAGQRPLRRQPALIGVPVTVKPSDLTEVS